MPMQVALTFDAEHPDRPTRPGVAEAIMEVLDRERVSATFFMQGRWAEAYPAIAAGIAQRGHLVGNHSHHHAPMTLLSDAGFATDVDAASAAIITAAGPDPRPWFRCPFGRGEDDPRVTSLLATLGYGPSVRWDVDGLDWDATSALEVEDRVVSGVLAHRDRAVVLLHTWPAPTAVALPGILARLRAAGATLVRLDAIE